MASGPITSWQIDGKTMETVTDFIFLGSKITAGGDCSHEIKRRLLLGRKAMTTTQRDGMGREEGVCACVCVCVCVYLIRNVRANCCLLNILKPYSSVQFSRSVMSDSLRPHESQHVRPPCPSPILEIISNSFYWSRSLTPMNLI